MSAKVLLVDDANLVLEIEKAIFRRTGAQILTASSGTQALKMVLSERPDIMLLDLILPDITGDKICEQIKSNPETAGIPIIMVTTRANIEDIERCRRAGCNDFTTKPINHYELLTKVLDLLRMPRRRAPRVLVRLETEVGHRDCIFFGTAIDISQYGMLLETSRAIAQGDQMSLRFQLWGRLEILVHGRVLRTEKLPFNKFRYGAEFIDLAPADQKTIADFIDAA